MQRPALSRDADGLREFFVTRADLEDCILIRVGGDVDMATAEEFLAALVPDSGRPLVIDLSETTFMDSTGLNALLAAQRKGAPIVLRRPSTVVRRSLAITGLDHVFTVEGE